MRSVLALWLYVGLAACTQAPVTSSATFPQTLTLDGRLTHADYERLFEREFDVPPGTRRIEIQYAFSGVERRTVVDLGLRGPSGLRGWGGSGGYTVSVSALSASPGYLPGPIEPGRWAVVLGIPNIRPGSEDTYNVIVRLFDEDLPPPSTVVRSGPGWYAGDLHAHSGHSDGRGRSRGGKPMRAVPFRVFESAGNAGLDFVLLSDHNTAAHWLDVDRLQPYYDDMLLLHGREVTTYRGHANTVGERAFHEFRLPAPDASPADLLRPIAASGAFVSINHPKVPDDETCMGCGWNVVDQSTMASVHGVEIVNGPLATGPQSGWSFWADLLNRGFRVTAVGGSDEHTPDDPADRNLGVPTTVIYARELSEPAIVDGLKSGRVYVRTEGPSGPALEFSAVAGGTTHPMGALIDISSPIDLVLHATVHFHDARLSAGLSAVAPGAKAEAPGAKADGAEVAWIRNGEVFAAQAVQAGPLTQSVKASPGDWFSLVVRRGDVPILFSNAIMLSRPRP